MSASDIFRESADRGRRLEVYVDPLVERPIRVYSELQLSIRDPRDTQATRLHAVNFGLTRERARELAHAILKEVGE